MFLISLCNMPAEMKQLHTVFEVEKNWQRTFKVTVKQA